VHNNVKLMISYIAQKSLKGCNRAYKQIWLCTDIKDGPLKKPVFRKPVKRSHESEKEDATQKKIERKESSSKKVKNKSLLSFDDEEDDDDE